MKKCEGATFRGPLTCIYPKRAPHTLRMPSFFMHESIFADMSASMGRKFKHLLSVIAESVPFKPNMSKLAEIIGAGRNRMPDYFLYIGDARWERPLLFYTPMQEVTPKVVAMAVSTVMTMFRILPQSDLFVFSMIF